MKDSIVDALVRVTGRCRRDRVLADVFEPQEELTHNIVMAIAPQTEAAEREKAHRRRPVRPCIRCWR